MIFITKVELSNFQSHKDTVLEFHRGLNVIVGHSDSGKTAILRAIKWALYNEPLGDYFIKQGESNVSVTITFNTGAVVRRFRSASKNTYYLKKADGEEFTFDGFGQKVPKEIIEEIGMYKINLDEKSTSIINIAEQLEGPFLLNEKPSVRASSIGRLVGVNYIDDALRETIRDNKQINTKLKDEYLEKENLIEELKKFEHLNDLEKTYNKLNDIKIKLKEKQAKLNNLVNLKNKVNELNNLIKVDDLEIKKYKNLDELKECIFLLSEKLYKLNYYTKLNNNYINAKKNITINKIIVDKYKNLELSEDIINQINSSLYKFIRLQKLNNRLKLINNEINNSNNIIDKYKEIDKLEDIVMSIDEKCLIYAKSLFYNKKLNEYRFRISKGEKYLEKFNSLPELFNIQQNLDKNIKSYNKLDLYKKNYEKFSQDINSLNNNINSIDMELEKRTDKYNNLLIELGHCPLCLSKIDEDTVSHIKDHFMR